MKFPGDRLSEDAHSRKSRLQSMAAMNDQEKYLFDLNGYIVVRKARSRPAKSTICRPELVAASARPGRPVHLWFRPHCIPQRRTIPPGPRRRSSNGAGPISTCIDLPSIAPYLETFSRRKHYRLRSRLHRHQQHGAHPQALPARRRPGGGRTKGRSRRARRTVRSVLLPLQQRQVLQRPGRGRLRPRRRRHPAAAASPAFRAATKQTTRLPDPDWRVSALPRRHARVCRSRLSRKRVTRSFSRKPLAHGTVPWQGNWRAANDLLQVLPARRRLGVPCYYNADHYGDLSEQSARHAAAAKRIRDPRGDAEPIWRQGARGAEASSPACASKWLALKAAESEDFEAT